MKTEINPIGYDVPEDLKAGKIHLVAYAHLGFSPLHARACKVCGLPIEQANAFVASVNKSDEVGTLFPKMPISALPKRFGRTDEDRFKPFAYEEYSRVLKDALRCNETAVKSPTLVFDLTCSLISQRPFLERVFQEFESLPSTHTKTVIGLVDQQQNFEYHPELQEQ